MPLIPSNPMSPVKTLFAVHTVFSIIFSFVNLFMNVFLWSAGRSFWAIGVFNLFSVTSIFLASLLGAYCLKCLGTRATFIFSSLLALLLFLFLLWTDSSLAFVLPLLGAMYGGYVGLFYIGFNLHILWLSGDQNRSYLIGIESMIATLAQLLTPVCAGLLIVTQGYRTTFLVIIVLLIIQLLLSLRIPGMKMRESYKKKYFFLAENETMAKIGFASAAYGFYFSFVQMSYGLFFYFLVEDEFRLGTWSFLFGLLSAFMYWLVGRILNQSNRDIWLGMGMIASMVVTLTLLLSATRWFVLFNLIISASLPMLWIPAKSSHYAKMVQEAGKNSRLAPHNGGRLGKMMQLLVFREFSISLGRIAFFLLLIIGFDFGLGPAYFVMVIAAFFMPVGIWVLSRET